MTTSRCGCTRTSPTTNYGTTFPRFRSQCCPTASAPTPAGWRRVSILGPRSSYRVAASTTNNDRAKSSTSPSSPSTRAPCTALCGQHTTGGRSGFDAPRARWCQRRAERVGIAQAHRDVLPGCPPMSAPLRVALIASNRFPLCQPFAGGLEAHVWHLARALVERGHEVSLFAGSGSDLSLDCAALTVRELTAFRCGTSGSVGIPGGVHGRSPCLSEPDDAIGRSPKRLRHRPQSQPAPSAGRHGSHVGHTDAHHFAHASDTVVGVGARRNRQRGYPIRRGQPPHRRRVAPRRTRRDCGAQRRRLSAVAAGAWRRQPGVVRTHHRRERRRTWRSPPRGEPNCRWSWPDPSATPRTSNVPSHRRWTTTSAMPGTSTTTSWPAWSAAQRPRWSRPPGTNRTDWWSPKRCRAARPSWHSPVAGYPKSCHRRAADSSRRTTSKPWPTRYRQPCRSPESMSTGTPSPAVRPRRWSPHIWTSTARRSTIETRRPMIGYYVHHHGSGHLNRAISICAQLRHPVVALTSLDIPRPHPFATVLRLPRDDWVRDPQNHRQTVHCIGFRITTTA